MDRWTAVPRLLADNRYLVLGTSDEAGRPWVTPLFFAGHDHTRLYWVSSADSRHSRNIGARPEVAITIFDSTVTIGQAEAVYLLADAAPAVGEGGREGLQALNAKLPVDKQLTEDDLQPVGPLIIYRADVRSYDVLIRGADPDNSNGVDGRLEVVPPDSLRARPPQAED